MASITKRENANGTVSWKAQVRIDGYPARTASHKTERAAKRWAATVEAAMHEGRHFRGSAARHHSLADAIRRYSEEYPNKGTGQLKVWSERIGTTRLHAITPDLIAEVRGALARGQ